MLGRKVAVLADGVLAAGQHEVQFDASHLASGTYLYRLVTDKQSFVKQMVLMK
jgi:serine protease AprX